MHDSGIVGGQRLLNRTQFDRGMLDLRLQLIRMRTEYLNQINTQSTLVASCAVSMLLSSELKAIGDNGDDEGWSPLWHWNNAIYVVAASGCLGTSLWVIYTAMNLHNLSIHSTLYGESMRALTEADNLIESRMTEVRLVFILSLVALVVAVTSMFVSEVSLSIACAGLVTLGVSGWHAVASDSGTVAMYERFTGLEVKDRWKSGNYRRMLMDLIIPFGCESSHSARKYIKLHETAVRALRLRSSRA